MADQLPPRAPNVDEHHDHHHDNWLDFVPNQASPPLGTTLSLADHNDSVNPIENHSSWVDEFMEFSATKRGAHRRSVSDSIAFVERVPVNDDDEFHARSAGNEDVVRKPTAEFDKFDDDQFMSMFNGDQLGNCTAAAAATPPMDVAGGRQEESRPNPTPTSSDHNSTNEERQACTTDYNRQDQTPQSSSKLVDRESQQLQGTNNTSSTAMNTTATPTENPSSEPVMDPKRVKRILANRQSAQRSRVRKLHYISELERRVTTLQSEVSMLSPRVAFLDHQRMLLNVDNSSLKAKIAALAQDKIFKDAHQDALRREIERLRQVYYQQCLQKAAAAATTEGSPVTITTTSSSPTPSTAAVADAVAHPPPPREAQFHEQQQQILN